MWHTLVVGVLSAYVSTFPAVVRVAVHISLAARSGAGDGPVVGLARLPAVGTEAGVVCLAVPAQVAGLCTARRVGEKLLSGRSPLMISLAGAARKQVLFRCDSSAA